jgi:hypothetical protein
VLPHNNIKNVLLLQAFYLIFSKLERKKEPSILTAENNGEK